MPFRLTGTKLLRRDYNTYFIKRGTTVQLFSTGVAIKAGLFRKLRQLSHFFLAPHIPPPTPKRVTCEFKF